MEAFHFLYKSLSDNDHDAGLRWRIRQKIPRACGFKSERWLPHDMVELTDVHDMVELADPCSTRQTKAL